MKKLFFGLCVVLVSCGQQKQSVTEVKLSDTVNEEDSFDPPGPVNPDKHAAAVISTSLRDSVNLALSGQFKNQWHVVTDPEAHWMRDQFDYFIASKRDSLPDYPYIATGDFNGDGRQDLAAVVTGEVKNAYRIIILPDGGKPYVWEEDVLENAAISKEPKADLRAMDVNGNPGKNISMKGDGILVEYFEQASFVIYWNGKKFVKVQQGD